MSPDAWIDEEKTVKGYEILLYQILLPVSTVAKS